MNDVTSQQDYLPPLRGLVAARDRRGRSLALIDLQRWLRLCRFAYANAKVDVLAGTETYPFMSTLLETASAIELRLSLRTADEPPTALAEWRDAGLLDAFVTLPADNTERLDAWLEAARIAELPLRVLLTPPFPEDLDPAAVTEKLAAASSVNVAVWDPFATASPCSNRAESERTLAAMNGLVHALNKHDIEANLLRLPFCMAPPENRPHVVNAQQFYLDHQHYQLESYELALRLFHRGPIRAKQAILILLGRYTSYPNPIDAKLLPWILDQPWVRARVWALHKFTRHIHTPWSGPTPRSPEEAEAAARSIQTQHRTALPEECQACALWRICDHDTPEFRRALPGLSIKRVPGEQAVGALSLSRGRTRHFDAVDAARIESKSGQDQLASEALEIIEHRPPDIALKGTDYEVEGQWNRQYPDSLVWFSWTNTEKVTTPLGRFEPPLTVSVTYGGGIADFIGFGFGRHARLLCPMEAFAHRVSLHVATDGRYVLLRDGRPVKPVEFAGGGHVPLRLPDVLEPRLVARNIDGIINTQGVSIWRGGAQKEARSLKAQFSAVIVSTRYARRLQATLLGLARQRGLETGAIEVIVAHVPGIDATGDVLDTVEDAHPELRIVRAPYAAEHTTAKGFLINETVKLASGDWVVLLDSDIVLHPDFLARLGELPPDVMFAIPDGRKMLDRATTARVLLGEIDPARDWQALIDGPGEYRASEVDGTPIGYCQCVRRACFDQVKYEEMQHFEGADWRFGSDMRERFGPEHRVQGLPVLHLDHGGSQWYGTSTHR